LDCEIPLTIAAVFSGWSTPVATSAWAIIPTIPLLLSTTGIRRKFMPRHRIQRLPQIVFGTAGYDLARHHLFCFRGFGISSFSHNLQSQIAIGHDTDQLLGLRVLDNGNRTDILALLRLCNSASSRLGCLSSLHYISS
jgi:hypothetical protein